MYFAEPVNLSIDIDGVLVNNFVVWKKYFNDRAKEHNHPLIVTVEDSPVWDYFLNICPICFKEVLTTPAIIESYPLVNDSLDILSFLKSIGCDLYLITARPDEVVESTYKWVTSSLGDLVSNTFVCEDKVSKAHEIGAKYHVDDAPRHIESFSKQTEVKSIIWDHPYNKNYLGPRIESWQQYAAYILWDLHKEK